MAAAMQHGHHVASEVPAATTIDDCWKLVNTSEETQRHCVMLENCCYGENETLILAMVRAGLFGDLLYGEAAYLHDLREELFSNKCEGLWRRTVHTERNGNLYPTHGLGPVANYMGINRGDRFNLPRFRQHPAARFGGLSRNAHSEKRSKMESKLCRRRYERVSDQDGERLSD
jgi:hypothetical protein